MESKNINNESKTFHFKYLDLVMVAFTAILILSNFAFSKIIDWESPKNPTFDAEPYFFLHIFSAMF